MDTGHNGVPGREQRLDELVTAYLKEVEAGRQPDRQALLADHPDLAADLAQFFDDQDALGGLAAPRRGPSPADPPAPERLGDFRIVRLVGRGGMGVVYEAEQVSLGRRVALKVLPLAATLAGTQLQRFHNEARAAAGLHHTNIVPVHFVGSERGVHFYAMQFIDGRSLAEVLARLRQAADPKVASPPADTATAAPVAPPAGADAAATQPAALLSTAGGARGRDYFRAVANLGVQAAEALDHGHRVGVVHRDVKPGNLLLDGSGRLWVTDFGLAHVQGADSLTGTGELVGTLRYMSPEQALGKRVVIDHRTDVYSLGATLYELLTLRPPFPGSDRQELLRQIAFDEPASPRRLERSVPAELEVIVLKALEKAPSDRYATAGELADDLRRFLEDRPIRARRPGVPQRLRKWTRRHRPVVTAVAVCLLLLLAVAAGSVGWVLGDRASRQREAEARAREALEVAAPRLRQGDAHDPELIAAVQRAVAQLDAGAVNPGLRGRVEQLRRDLEMLAALEQARLHGAAGNNDTGFDFAGADKLYARAFAAYAVDLAALSPPEAAERVRGSAIRTHLVAALDDWDKFHRGGGSVPGAVAALADDDPWRQQVREATRRGQRAVLEELARQDGTLRQPPASIVLLGYLLRNAKSPAAAERLLRQAQQEQPGDFWINLELAQLLANKRPPEWKEAVPYYRAALALRPQSPAVFTSLGVALRRQGKLAEALAACRKAIELGPDLGQAYAGFGTALGAQGHLADAEAAFRKAIELKPDLAEAHNNLGLALAGLGKPAEAEAAYRRALALKPDHVPAYTNLGSLLRARKRLAEAETALRKAIELDPDLAEAHNNLGSVLLNQARRSEAIAAYRRALELKPNYAEAHYNLGLALFETHQTDEAVAEYREAIRIRPDDADSHHGLAEALAARGRPKEAIEEYREAVHLNKGWAQAHNNLGTALFLDGQVDEAIAEFRAALGLRKGYRLAQSNLVEALQVKVAQEKLPRILKGEVRPADAAERLGLAALCQQPFQRLYAASARFYEEAFAEKPQLADDLRLQHRYNAACAAAQAGCGRGKDTDGLDDREKARLRRQGLAWLRADLEAWQSLLAKDPNQAGPAVAPQLAHWLDDPDLACVRGEPALARLPEAERGDWQKLWQEVEALRQRAAGPPEKEAVPRP